MSEIIDEEMSYVQTKESLRDEYKGLDTQQLAEKMRDLQQRKALIAMDLSGINAALDVIRFDLIPEKMDEEGIERATYEGIGTLYLTSGVRASMLGAEKPAAYQWLDDNGHGGLITQTVNAQSLASACKAMLKKGEAIPENLFKVTPFTQAVIKFCIGAIMAKNRYKAAEAEADRYGEAQVEEAEPLEAPILTAQEVMDKLDQMRKVYPVLNGDLYEIARYVNGVDPSVEIPGVPVPEPEPPPVADATKEGADAED